MRPLSDNVDEMFIGPFGSSLKNDCFVKKDSGYCMVYEQKHAIQKTMDVETRYVTEEKYNELKRFNICGGDIIVSCRGTIGETFIVPDDAPLGIMHPSIMKIRLKKDVYDKSYFNLLLQKWLRKHETGANGSGVKMAISAKKLGAELFPVPPIEEQRKISDIILKVHQIINERTQQLQKLDELVKSRFIELFGDPMNGTSKWKVSTIGEQFNVTSGGTPATGEKAYWDNGTIPWIGSNMCQDTILIKNDGKFITEEGYIHSSAKWFYKGTVLVALVGATIGKTALLRFDTTTNQNIAAIDVNGNAAFSSEFVFYHMQMLYAKFMEIGNGKFKMANQGFIRQLPLVCPPLALQQRFAAFVEQADKSKVTIQKALDEAQLLFDSLMQKYFG
jgi:hsdS protein